MTSDERLGTKRGLAANPFLTLAFVPMRYSLGAICLGLVIGVASCRPSNVGEPGAETVKEFSCHNWDRIGCRREAREYCLSERYRVIDEGASGLRYHLVVDCRMSEAVPPNAAPSPAAPAFSWVIRDPPTFPTLFAHVAGA
jgi:hypothetical protein